MAIVSQRSLALAARRRSCRPDVAPRSARARELKSVRIRSAGGSARVHVSRACQLVIDCTSPEPLALCWAEALHYVIAPPPSAFDSWDDCRRHGCARSSRRV
jgi:hypothetical protein